jgi:hypothetical protein
LKKTSDLNRALAIANLINLGFSPEESFGISTDWAERQFAQSLEKIDATLIDAAVDAVVPGLGKRGRMYASFHYSLYPAIYRALGEHGGPGVVYSLIGQQQEGHRHALQQIARRFGFQIEFIQSNTGMVRTLRRAIQDGIPGILLIDIPWTKQGNIPDQCYPVRGGHFKGFSSLERLLSIIDDEYEILYTCRSGDRYRIDSGGTLALGDAFQRFGELLHRDPAEYERLNQFHRFFEFDQPKNCAVTFRIKDTRYVIHAASKQAWQIASEALEKLFVQETDTVYHSEPMLNALSKETKHEFEYLVSL